MNLASICKKCRLKDTCEGLPEYFSGCLDFEKQDETEEILNLYGACG